MARIILLKESNDALDESNYAPKGVKLHPLSQITLLVGSFDPFKEVMLDIVEYLRWHINPC